jgi:hypothetical protein
MRYLRFNCLRDQSESPTGAALLRAASFRLSEAWPPRAIDLDLTRRTRCSGIYVRRFDQHKPRGLAALRTVGGIFGHVILVLDHYRAGRIMRVAETGSRQT